MLEPGCRRYGLFRYTVSLVLLGAALFSEATAATRSSPPKPTVDLALVLAIDCSASVDGQEFRLQMDGLSAALSDPAVIAAIAAGPAGRIAVTVVQWSGATQQAVMVPWRIIAGARDAHDVAHAIANTPRMVRPAATSMRAMIDLGVSLLARAPFTARRSVIDVAADGLNNAGGAVTLARDRALAAGVTVNGLAILTEYASLPTYFRQFVITGPDAFVEEATSFSDYRRAIRRKLLREIVPALS